MVSALFGDAALPLSLSSPTGFWQSSVGSDFGSSINPGLFGAIPELEYDSWLTIGSESTIGAGSGISQVGMTAALSSFNNGGDLNLQAANGGSWFVTFGNANAIAGDDLKVLVAQLTVEESFFGIFNVQMFNGGIQANESIIEQSCFSTSFGFCAVSGCMDAENCNYNPVATQNDPEACLEDFDGDGICNVDEVMGCIFSIACNYNPEATDDDGSCVFYCPGCTNPEACNFDSGALQDDGSCELPEALCGEPHVDCDCECLNDADGDGVCDEAEIAGCQFPSACNYNPDATDPAPCETTSCAGCVYSYACNYDPEALYSDGSCEFGTCLGCTNPSACNFNPTVSEDDGSCQFADECGECGGEGPVPGFDCDGNCLDTNANSICDIDESGCTDSSACNFNPQASSDDGSCAYPTACLDCQLQCIDANENGVCDCDEVEGCMDDLACNFDPTANLPSTNCEYPAPYFNCSGDCLQDADSDGICDELESVYELGFNDGAESCNPAGCGESACGNGTEWSDALEMCVPVACFGDFDADGLRGSSDLLLFLAVYGDVCPE